MVEPWYFFGLYFCSFRKQEKTQEFVFLNVVGSNPSRHFPYLETKMCFPANAVPRRVQVSSWNILTATAAAFFIQAVSAGIS